MATDPLRNGSTDAGNVESASPLQALGRRLAALCRTLDQFIDAGIAAA